MRGGARLLMAAALTVAGCTTGSELHIRAAGNTSPGAGKPVPAKIAEAHAQLALGNVGLALELYRKALREQPDNLDAPIGMAACYDQMGRFDLSRRYYEAALARDPASADVLTRFARSLELQGRPAEAAAVRQEISARLAATVAEPPAQALPVRSAAQAQVVTQPAPAAEEIRLARPVERVAQPQIAAASITIALPPVEASAIPGLAVDDDAADAPQRERAKDRVPTAASATTHIRASKVPLGRQPRLERMSPAHVALITTGVPQWQPRVIAKTAQSTTVRFVPLKSAGTAPLNLRLLNAARAEGLAARTRNYLLARGWRKIGIGDAADLRMTSVILYPESRRRTAQILAAQFNLPIARRASGGDLILLLGRDAAGLKALQARS